MANKSLTVGAGLSCWLAVLTLLPAQAAAQCQLCAEDAATAAAAKPVQPIAIQIETRMDFSRIGLVQLGQGGTARLDPATGQRVLTGNLLNLGGVPLVGTVTVRGQPNQHVQVSFPSTVTIFNSSGAGYQITGFTTTLKNNPKLAQDGTLRFTFGGTLQVTGAATGTFQGSVPVTVEYR